MKNAINIILTVYRLPVKFEAFQDAAWEALVIKLSEKQQQR